MPTIPPERPPLTVEESHQAREMAESFGSDPERYDRTRPRYPDAMVERIVVASPGPDVLDVGCGTGIAARQFHAAGCRMLGVDVDARMAEFARLGGLDVEVSAFEIWDPAGRVFDAVIAGQTWHWVDPVAGAAKAADVLRPGGRLALFWNSPEPPPELADALAGIYRQGMPGCRPPVTGSNGRSLLSAKTIRGIRQAGGFGEPEEWQFEWERPYTRDELLDELPTSGALARLSPEKLSDALADARAAVDTLGERFTLPYKTFVVTAARA